MYVLYSYVYTVYTFVSAKPTPFTSIYVGKCPADEVVRRRGDTIVEMTCLLSLELLKLPFNLHKYIITHSILHLGDEEQDGCAVSRTCSRSWARNKKSYRSTSCVDSTQCHCKTWHKSRINNWWFGVQWTFTALVFRIAFFIINSQQSTWMAANGI